MTISEGETKQFSFRKRPSVSCWQDPVCDGCPGRRYYLNGLLLLVEGKELRAVATDGHRLAFASVAIETELPRQEMILPRKTVLELNRLLVDTDDALNITLTSNQVRFAFGSVVLVSKLIDGKFPDYERVVPATLKNHMKVGRQTLMQAMQRAAILTNEKFRACVVLGDNSLKLIAANAEQEEAQEEIEVDYTGDIIDVGFNVGYLLDVLNNHADEIQWSFNDANSSALITLPATTASSTS
jgi:DNA polymerase-3 subunit beta